MKRLLFASSIALLVFGVSGTARAVPIVAPGWDLFVTGSPTDFAGVPFEGAGIGDFDFGAGLVPVGATDTIIERLGAADCIPPGPPFPCSDTIDIELVALSLVSTAPVDFGLGVDFYFVELDPLSLGSFGEMAITFDGEFGGTFTSTFFNIDVEIHKGSAIGPVALALTLFGLTNPGTPWGRAHPPGALLIDGVNHNLNGLDHGEDIWPGVLPGGTPQGCFVHGGEGPLPASHCIITTPQPTPEPSAGILLALGLLAWAGSRRRQ